MKTDKISFPSVNGKIDSNLVRAMEALPSYSYATKPCVSGIECYMTKRDVIVYPSWLEATLFCVKQSYMADYGEHLAFTSFRIGRFSYKFLKRNPFNRYDAKYGK